jgi:hypothetical protein
VIVASFQTKRSCNLNFPAHPSIPPAPPPPSHPIKVNKSLIDLTPFVLQTRSRKKMKHFTKLFSIYIIHIQNLCYQNLIIHHPQQQQSNTQLKRYTTKELGTIKFGQYCINRDLHTTQKCANKKHRIQNI